MPGSFTYDSVVIEAAAEFQFPLWICAIDFKKAFDTVEHDHLWESLYQQTVPHVYIKMLARLYSDQTANVVTDKVSRTFQIGRGTKQGDPISPELFNAVLDKLSTEQKRNGAKLILGYE